MWPLMGQTGFIMMPHDEMFADYFFSYKEATMKIPKKLIDNFGCEAGHVRELMECIGHTIEKEPEGVYVKPGMRVVWGGEMFTVAPKGTWGRRLSGDLDAWNEDGEVVWLTPQNCTHNGKPVLGYKE